MRVRLTVLAALILVVASIGCSSEKAKGTGGGTGVDANNGGTHTGGTNNGIDPFQLVGTAFTYRLEESQDELILWTASVNHKVRSNERAPDATKSGIKISAARNEFEPFQIVLNPGSGEVTVRVEDFPNLGADQRITVHRVDFQDGWAEGLTPMDYFTKVSRSGKQSQPFLVTVYVPQNAPAGEHKTTVTVGHSDGIQATIPVTLRVFDFALPKQIHFATQLNLDISKLVPSDGTVDDAKTMLYELRMTPKSVNWPSGFNPTITWDNSESTDPCNILWDEPDEPEQFSIGSLSKRYMLGEDWNGVGFPNSMIFQFVDNSTPRPNTFCGISRGDHFGSPQYNTEWSEFLTALEDYLRSNGLIDKAYYYVQNEPQNDTDHKLAAHLCRLTRKAAPGLRIAISEEPKPQIAEDPQGSCGYDIWIAHIRAYQQTYALKRQKDFGEQVWFYSLDQDPDPYFNPTRVDKQGMHMRIIPWVSWHYRVTGFAYYDANRWFKNGQPTMRAVLLREGFEDYEYLWLANNRNHPKPSERKPIDETVDSIAPSLTNWSKDPDALLVLRSELGKFIEGSRDTYPVLVIDNNKRKRGAYYINFQDPDGRPDADPLMVDGKTWIKIGWDKYDPEKGYGWFGENVDNPSIALYGFDLAGGNDLDKSYLYDDYGRDGLFEFDLENGTYKVTVAVGRPSKGYPNDPHNVSVEGTVLVDDEITTNETPMIVRSLTVELRDGRLSLEIGGKSEKTNDWAYTFVAWMSIEPI